MEAVSVAFAACSMVDLCLKCGRSLHSRCQAYTQAEGELAKTVLYIGGYWLKIENQVTTLRDIWHGLDGRLQIHYNHVLQELHGILESAVHMLDNLIGDPSSISKVDNLFAKQGQIKRLKYATHGKRSLERVIEQLERWHRQFDPSWILLSRSSVPVIQKQLEKKGQSGTEATAPITQLREVYEKSKLPSDDSSTTSRCLDDNPIEHTEETGTTASTGSEPNGKAVIIDNDTIRKDADLEPSNEDRFTTLHELGKTLYEQSDYTVAEAAFRQAFEGRTQTFGATHEHTLASLSWLGRSFYWNEEYTKANAAFREAFESHKMALGATHEHTLTSLWWLGRSLYWNEEYTRANAAFQEVFESHKMALGATHEHTLTSLWWLGRSLYWNEEYARAATVFQEVFEGYKITLGATHPDTLTSLQWLGRSHYWNEEYAKAEAVFQQVFESYKMTLGSTHEQTLTSLWWLGRSLYWLEDYTKAEAAFRQGFESYEMILGAKHSGTLMFLEWLDRSLYYLSV